MNNLTAKIVPYSTSFDMTISEFASRLEKDVCKITNALKGCAENTKSHNIVLPMPDTVEKALLGAILVSLSNKKNELSGRVLLGEQSAYINVCKNNDGSTGYKVGFSVELGMQYGAVCKIKELANLSDWYLEEWILWADPTPSKELNILLIDRSPIATKLQWIKARVGEQSAT